jgi:hypothetical protein
MTSDVVCTVGIVITQTLVLVQHSNAAYTAVEYVSSLYLSFAMSLIFVGQLACSDALVHREFSFNLVHMCTHI